ncbi:hypothetical protein HMPREF1212_01077 [Parabacteroides sp. HGS0025]|uniref:hypothetical protein n=1 Tax=Parabacteroides sp. HGS0025 TaxID=1078087 RepID=UPI0006171E62|nr:hypothetical protein [Parabacteroides sp. HGS0025]KKB52917.1 hypothetical protein HMPREF1212_01077 [Parabacteroides sp. HGS0025]
MRQIKIRHWISILLLPLAAFYSCNVEEINRGDDTPLPEGITRLTATVGSGLKTRAVGDLLGDATNDEKRIDRLAFFVHTEAEGMQVYEPAKTGETHTDFPNKVQLEATVPGDPSGGYTATVDLTTGAGYDADIIAVANLPEDYDYSQIVSWQGLLDSVAVGTFTSSMPLCTGNDGAAHDNAFVMYGSTTVALHKEKEETFNLSLERLTARIDITNEAYVAGMTDDDPKGGFLLTGVRILHARPQSYIVPQMDYVSPDVATVSDWKATPDQIRLVKIDGENATDVTDGTPDEQATATCQRIWHSLYTYENHETEHAPTGLEITGKFRGLSVTRQIPFEVTETDGTKRAVPVVRNHRYLVSIKPAPGQTDLTYSVQVGEWNAVDTVNVQPNQDQLPVVTNVICAEASKSYGGDLAGGIMPDTLVVPADGGTLTFTASCPFDTRVTAEYFSPEDGNSWLEVTDRSEATVTKGDISLAREYTVTIKPSLDLKAGLDKDPTYTNAYVNRAYLYIANGGNGSVVDTVVVYQGTDIPYSDTRFAAVTLGEANGKEIVWAPLNVGATELTTGLVEVPQPTDPGFTSAIQANELQCGSYFQWGRKTPFSYSASQTAKTTSTQFNSVEEAESSTLRYYNSVEDSWLSGGLPPNLWNAKGTVVGESESVTDIEKTAYDPCPTGWRIPTKTELEALKATGMTHENNSSKNYTSIKKANAELRLPKGGGITSIASFMCIESLCWSSTLSATRGYMWVTNNWGICPFTGFCVPIRCVQE